MSWKHPQQFRDKVCYIMALPQSEFYFSAAVGLVASIILIKLGSGPAVFKFNDDDEDNLEVPTQSHSSETVGAVSLEDVVEEVPQINKSYAMKKLAPVQNILGLSDDQMGKVIQDTNEQLVKSPDTSQLDVADNLNRLVDGFVFLVGIIFCCYAINVFSHGDFGRMLAGLFPIEADSLKITDFLNNFRVFR